jgi:hypothetical protein
MQDISESRTKAVEKPQISEPTNTRVVMVATAIAMKDDRAEKLDAYFKVKGSPFYGKGKNFVEVADKYDLDWTLLPAIANLESQLGKAIPVGSFNPYGWNNGKYRFASWEAANETVANGLRTRYAPTGAITPARIGSRYAESPTWAVRVAKYQSEITKL